MTQAADQAADDLPHFIFGLPKAELHVHLEGTMEPELYLEIAHRNHLQTLYPDAAAVRQRMRDAIDLPSFIEVYEELNSVLRAERDFHDIVMAYLRKAHAQGVVYVEMHFDPQLHLERGVPLATIFAGLASARHDAATSIGVDVHYIMGLLRDRSAEDAAQVLEASLPWRSQFLGVGLDNPEVTDFPLKFQAVFARARALDLHRTSHCDVDQPNTVAHHWGALNLLGVERIDHGLNVLDDPALIVAVRERGIGLTVAPTLLYRDIPGRMEYRAGAIRKLLDEGVLVAVNSDDPGMMRSLYVSDLLLRVQQTAGLSRDQIVRLAKNSFQMAWLSDPVRQRYLAAVDAYVAGFAAH